MSKQGKIDFLLPTDWMFEKPIDSEHKEYKLLSYFQKMGEKLDNLELYPGFIELSLHLINIQTLYKQRKIIYTDKKFSAIDDELLLKDLKIKNLPDLTPVEFSEFNKILQYSSPMITEYFEIAKSIWSAIFDSVDVKLKKNKKFIRSNDGFFFYRNLETNMIYIWKYNIKKVSKSSTETKTTTKLLFKGLTNNLTIPKIFLNIFEKNPKLKKDSPIFEMKSKGVLPIEETLLPIFKRKVMSYILQTILFEKQKEDNLNISID